MFTIFKPKKPHTSWSLIHTEIKNIPKQRWGQIGLKTPGGLQNLQNELLKHYLNPSFESTIINLWGEIMVPANCWAGEDGFEVS